MFLGDTLDIERIEAEYWEKIGAELVKRVAQKTDDIAGDGTTIATVLAQALVREGLRNVAAGGRGRGARRAAFDGGIAVDRAGV